MNPLFTACIALLGTALLCAEEKPESGDQKSDRDRREDRDRGERRDPNRGRGPDRGFFEDFLRKGDQDGDGAVTLEEFSALERVAKLPEEKRAEIFRRLDKNHDGRIQRDDMPKPPEGRRRDPLNLRELDVNRDGEVSFEEFTKSPFVAKLDADHQKRFFARLDNNDDGKLSPADRPDRNGRRDRRGPGRDGDRDPGALIRKLDRDDDGSVSFEEFRKAPWIEPLGEDQQEDHFEAMDRNGDLKLDESDFQRPRKGGPPAPEEDC